MAYRDGNLKMTSINGVKIYSITGQARALPTWTSDKKLRSLRKDKDYTEGVQLLQDLRFETATTRIKATSDGEYLIASGIYPPQVKVYELRSLALKFERHLISEIINFEVLGDDYSKIAFLCADRSVCLHAKYGSHYSLRIPRMGRDIAYDSWSCDLLCAASSPELYRINLEQGRFLSSLVTQSPGLNVVTRSKIHGLVACGGDDGAVECFDMRMRSSVGRLDVVAHAKDRDQEVTAVEFDGEGGYSMAVGSSSGKVLIYDMRSSHPMRVKDHMYGSPIIDIKWQRTLNSEKPKLVTTDSKIVRIWDPETGEGLTSIEPKDGAINDICVFNGSGLMLLALNSTEIPSYFIPDLGPAPKWCPYLETLVDPMEADAETTIYDDFKFLTKEELEKLGLANLIGTHFLRAYMHGFFVHYKIYKKALASANPFAYDEYIREQKQKKIEKERETRITIKRRMPKVKVNKDLLLQIEEENENENKNDKDGTEIKKKSKKKKGLSGLLTDDRFTSIFENEDFEVDKYSEEYLALHPLAPTKQPSLIHEHFNAVSRDDNSTDSDASASSNDDNDQMDRKKHRAPRLYEVKDERHADAFLNHKSLAEEHSLPLGERVAAIEKRDFGSRYSNNDIKAGPGGSREISFVSRSKSRYKEDDDDGEMEDPRRKKRGVQSLRLKPDRSSGFGGRGGRGRGRERGRGGSRGRGRGRSRW